MPPEKMLPRLSLNNLHAAELGRYFILLLAFSCILIGGCATYNDLPAGTVKEIGSAIVEQETVTVPPEQVEPPPSADYLIGPGDVISITVAGRPEFSFGGSNAPATNALGGLGSAGKAQGTRVDGNGNVFLPLVGEVRVAGLTVSQAQTALREKLRKFVQEPWVQVEIAEYKSQPVYLLGQFRNPGTYYLEGPTNILQAVSLAKGIDPAANLRGARISRSNKIMRIDLADLFLNGDVRQNVWLKGGDAIYVPDTLNQQVFVFGAVKKSGPVPMPSTGLNLAQAIATAELRDLGPDFRHVRIIRSLSATRGELIVLDFSKILRGEAMPIPLREGDIVFVPKTAVGNWNDAIAEFLPSLQAFSALFQPFVTIKYLSK